MVVASQEVSPLALLRSLESLLQLLKVSLKALNDPLIPGARHAFTLQLLTQALAFAMVVRTSLALQLQLLREALEFSLQLQVLPPELFETLSFGEDLRRAIEGRMTSRYTTSPRSRSTPAR